MGSIAPHFTKREEIFKCPGAFKSRAGLTSHVMWKHPPETTAPTPSNAITVAPAVPTREHTIEMEIEVDVKHVMNQLLSSAEDGAESVAEPAGQKAEVGRRGAVKRKSYDFMCIEIKIIIWLGAKLRRFILMKGGGLKGSLHGITQT